MLNHSDHNRRRILAALACLLAIAFLYAPLAGAAWSATAMDCCINGICNIPKHHHKTNPAPAAAHEDCGHDMANMMNCSMSCCQDTTKPAVTAMAFVMPPPAFTTISAVATRAAEQIKSIEIPRAIEPASPPPRIA